MKPDYQIIKERYDLKEYDVTRWRVWYEMKIDGNQIHNKSVRIIALFNSFNNRDEWEYKGGKLLGGQDEEKLPSDLEKELKKLPAKVLKVMGINHKH